MRPYEFQEIIKAWFAISLAFAILLARGNIFSSNIIYFFLVSGFTVGIGFLCHELAHRYFARKYGYRAEFRAFDFMLVLAILMSFFGFIIAAPGAVFIDPRGKRFSLAKNGKISLAGPMANFILAIIFLNFHTFSFGIHFLQDLGRYGFLINTWLGLFNLIPFGNFDGSKVFAWNKGIYGLAVLLGIIMLFFH